MNTETFDVAVIGAGPSGATAAAYLASHKLAVALVDGSSPRAGDDRTAWLSPRAQPLLKELKVKFHAETDVTALVNEVTFHSSDFSKTARPKFTEHVGTLVDRNRFGSALCEAAKAHGATLIANRAALDVRLNEKEVAISLADGGKITSRLLVLATGCGSGLTSRLGFRSEIGESPLWIAQVEGRTKNDAGDGDGKVGIVLGLDGGNGFSWCAAWRDRAVVNVNLTRNVGQANKQLESVCRGALVNGLLPVDLSIAAGKAPVYRSPAGAALDLDTHVAKHTLLIGDAGGFVSAASNEGLYPAMWSAKLAAETIADALTTRFSQDTLMSFDSKWRMQMADYLRSPHTDVRFLLPLIFSNQPMADRMGAAFFFGENM